MSFFTPQTQVVQIDDENTITIRKPTFDERMDLFTRVANHGDDERVAGIELAKFAPKILVCAWSGPGFEGREVTPENVGALPPYILEKFANILSDWVINPVAGDEKKVSGATTNG